MGAVWCIQSRGVVCPRRYLEGEKGGMIACGRNRITRMGVVASYEGVRTAKDDYPRNAVLCMRALHLRIPGIWAMVVRLTCLFHHLLSPIN